MFKTDFLASFGSLFADLLPRFKYQTQSIAFHETNQAAGSARGCIGAIRGLFGLPLRASHGSFKHSAFQFLDGSGSDNCFPDSGYPSGISGIFAFFLKPDLLVEVFRREYQPVPSNWHDNTKECHVIYAQVRNKGKTANTLGASILVDNCTQAPENLYWNLPSHDSNPPLVLERLQRGATALLSVGYIIPKEKLWKLETYNSSFRVNPHILENDHQYHVGISIAHEPSRIDRWVFTLALHGDGKADIGQVYRATKS